VYAVYAKHDKFVFIEIGVGLAGFGFVFLFLGVVLGNVSLLLQI